MIRVRIRTPSRLHFGLLSWGPDSPRQFGGVGLMIDDPGIEVSAEPAPRWGAEGTLADRARTVAKRVADRLSKAGVDVRPAHLLVRCAPPEHVGLGVGTQLSLAVTEAIGVLSGLSDVSPGRLARLAGRGRRSGIGLYGYHQGGLIVDGGRGASDTIPPLLSHLPFPPEWIVIVVIPDRALGLHGPEEIQAFAALPPIADRMTDRLCRLVLLGLMPALIERDLAAFGVALTELQKIVGSCFAPAQGGLFAQPELERMAAQLRQEGLHGVGQSSWGPTLYGLIEGPVDSRSALLSRLRDRLGLGPRAVFATQASTHGRVIERELP